jgi:4-amino-4-deoxychorismate lyase
MSFLPRYFFSNDTSSGSASAPPPDTAYSEGLLETMCCQLGRIPLWPLHRARLQRSGRIPEHLLDAIESVLLPAASNCGEVGPVKVRLRLGEINGQCRWDISLLPLEPQPEIELGMRLFPCSTRLPRLESANPGCKLLQRANYNRASAELPADLLPCDGLLLDSENWVIESLRCNLLIWRDQGWVTPSLRHCGVAGVMRSWLGERVMLDEVDITLAELGQAEELALCNSVRGVIPVRELIGHRHWTPGAQTRRLQRLVAEELW